MSGTAGQPTPEQLGGFRNSNEHFSAEARINTDGRINIHVTDKASKLTKYLAKRARYTHGQSPLGEDLTSNNRAYENNFQSILGKYKEAPKLNIAIHIVGSRGDVQPFIAIAQELMKPPYGHRVRICTHPVFKTFVEENGIEFFSIGGDPATLMAYMVKNPGLMPGMESLRAGDVGKRRNDIAEIIEGCWRGCIEPGDGMPGSKKSSSTMSRQEETDRLFIADAIIANPPSYAHIHCAEKLGIPLHMMFTMPWSPTQHFPHPLASLDRNEADPGFANYISYTMMELLAWQGLGDIINGFRVRTLHLDPISPLWGHMLLSRMKVPFTYAWSSELIPKPPDWASHINISGFSFLSQASNYKPPEDLVAFLNAGPPPVYIGFGSIVVDHPDKLTQMIFGAVKRAGVRALVSKGWGGLGEGDVPEGIFLLGNVPHDWLFQYVSAVVHHGGAGTTAIGIAMGKPTVVVPFFGDQPFWGAMIHRAGAGPEPVPFKKMTEESLAHSITTALTPNVQTAVKHMSEEISQENGAAEAAKPCCSLESERHQHQARYPSCCYPARCRDRSTTKSQIVSPSFTLPGNLLTIKRIRHRDWYVDEGAGDPVQGFLAAASGTVTSALTIFVDYTRSLSKTVHKDPINGSPLSAEEDDEDKADPRPEAARTKSLEYIPTRNPVQKAAHFSPEHLDYVALKMASKTLKSTTDKQKHKRAYTWSPVQRSPSLLLKGSDKQVHYHGRLHDASVETGHFAYAMGATALRLPVAFFYNLANGFHNAPSFVLNDDTVRRRENITGFGSGVKVAANEVIYGLFDGVTGIVRLPVRGARKSGPMGFIKGIGKGLGALPLKVTAAAFGMPGYTLKGLEKQLEKRYSRGLKASLLVVRIKQGIMAFERSSEEEREEVRRRWRELEGAN
ncbi:related to sterol glucosyltransferase [Phialocephala subalpina]|uniref:Related to sterol glucosyltransferase n=1 Tax=Phialocephala subalpina TaxID=576137 RepID=A0A1L7WIV4_9HELO|nr:related to sterol glucosyltransferase [Phialocephala subalpina]